mmetsp:Transcript_24409/g.45486  ORF Transcript_24409/g.45486 Transcript_24409/m.45486 type:complete len:249 (+) Transcript_24409:107-853(+)
MSSTGSVHGGEPSDGSITVEFKEVTDVSIYKVLAGGEGRSTLASYNESVACAAGAFTVSQAVTQHDTLDGDGRPAPVQDWRGLYTQFQRDHVLGTIPYRWDGGHDTATLVKVTFATLNVALLDGPLLYDHNVTGTQKATIVKRILGISESKPLVETLGKRGQVALVRETEREWELVIPHNLLPQLDYQEQIIAKFRRHAILPITYQWCAAEVDDENNTLWELWQDGENVKLHRVVPDLDTSFLTLEKE